MEIYKQRMIEEYKQLKKTRRKTIYCAKQILP